MKRCLWLREALSDDDDIAQPLTGDQQADVGIVGGGYTGLWSAIRIKEARPDLAVTIVEKDICGGGASGRNLGFVLSWWAKFFTLKKLCGEAGAIHLAHASADAVKEIGEFCDAHGIDAHYRYDGWLWTATCEPHMGAWRATIEELKRHNLRPLLELDREEVFRRTGSRRHLGGAFEENSASVQPALLARGLRRVALEMGVTIFEESPMTQLERSSPTRICTNRGSLTAGKVILAMNAWGTMLPEIRRAIIVVQSNMVATEPVADRLQQVGLADGVNVSDSQLQVEAYRTTPDGRLIVAKGGIGPLAYAGRVGRAYEGISRNAAELEGVMKRFYPEFSNLRCPESWVGPIDRSKSGLPMFGRLGDHPDIFYGVGYSGSGVGPSVVGGRILASLALGVEDEWSTCGLVRPLTVDFPPEPICHLGGRIVQKAARLSDAAEEKGHRPNFILRQLTALAPPGFSQTE
ncbi:MAG: aminophosphonate oxidoreductase [Verrucomicrobia bacterium]|nr:MAG: aminophosphonate oxidoreductase [Verrucomicrobiota bacterium]